MNKYPEFAEVNNKKYKINTDFKTVLKCLEILEDVNIGEVERNLALIYILFGDEALDDTENYESLLKIAVKFICCNNKPKDVKNVKQDFDYIQDYDFIETSFMSDYRIDLSTTKIHWWKFINLFNGLSNSDMGNCCIINRIRSIRNANLNSIKNPIEREKLKKAKEQFALKSTKKQPTKQEQKSAREFYKSFLERGDNSEN